MQKHKTLLVIIPDRLSALVEKGEITARYYNPGNLFDEVHILMTNDDKPNLADVQKTVGNAELYLHNLLGPSFMKTFGWRPWLLKGWAKRAVDLAREISPELIRCHGNHFNGFAAAMIKKELGIPYVVSMHTQPDENKRLLKRSFRMKINNYFIEHIARIGIQYADVVISVYQSIVTYLDRREVKNIKVVYNVLAEGMRKKEDYNLSNPVKIISVGRQIQGKNPVNLIRAIAWLKNVELTMVGDGKYHESLKEVAKQCGSDGRIKFIRAIPNNELSRLLTDCDIFATHSDYCGIPKAVMEPLLVALPVVVNKRRREAVPEYQDNFLMIVDDTVEGYKDALEKLINDDEFREQLGRKAYAHAQKNWAPEKMEAKYVEVYKRVMADGEKSNKK